MNFLQNAEKSKLERCNLTAIAGNLNDRSIQNYFITLQIVDDSDSELLKKMLPWLLSTAHHTSGSEESVAIPSSFSDKEFTYFDDPSALIRHNVVKQGKVGAEVKKDDHEFLPRTNNFERPQELEAQGGSTYSLDVTEDALSSSLASLSPLNPTAPAFTPQRQSSSPSLNPKASAFVPQIRLASSALDPNVPAFVPQEKPSSPYINFKVPVFIPRGSPVKIIPTAGSLSPSLSPSAPVFIPSAKSSPNLDLSAFEREDTCHPWACYCPVCSTCSSDHEGFEWEELSASLSRGHDQDTHGGYDCGADDLVCDTIAL
ncbi:hypothetical protein CPB84DRAFT_1751827 [Gymnopilus junonius]|uniref:Uncharacterized protein n=1 Tax=Gymnopilus junonius TaxID=109634 RepID=A0A9P5TI28_GYMJU|nr:hypothetical protein CPB84DRAFT_1751827 [Gymnopilus junonius]